jgi:hypothetical protein
MLGKGARIVRFQDSERSEWRAMLRRKKHEGAAYPPLYARLAYLLMLFCSRLLTFRCWRVELFLARLRWLTGLAICIPGGDSILSAQENRMGIGPGIVCVGGAVIADDFPIA